MPKVCKLPRYDYGSPGNFLTVVINHNWFLSIITSEGIKVKIKIIMIKT